MLIKCLCASPSPSSAVNKIKKAWRCQFILTEASPNAHSTYKQHTTPDLLAKNKKCQNVVVRLLLLSFENLAIFGQSKTKRFYKYVLPSITAWQCKSSKISCNGDLKFCFLKFMVFNREKCVRRLLAGQLFF